MSGLAAADAADLASELQGLETTGDCRQRDLEELSQIFTFGLRKRPERVLDLCVQGLAIPPCSHFPLYSVTQSAYCNLCVGLRTELTNLLNAIS